MLDKEIFLDAIALVTLTYLNHLSLSQKLICNIWSNYFFFENFPHHTWKLLFHFSFKAMSIWIVAKELSCWALIYKGSIPGLRNNNINEGNSLGWQYLLQLAFINTLSLQSSTPWTPRNFCIEKGYLIGYFPIYWIVLKISKWKLIISSLRRTS